MDLEEPISDWSKTSTLSKLESVSTKDNVNGIPVTYIISLETSF